MATFGRPDPTYLASVMIRRSTLADSRLLAEQCRSDGHHVTADELAEEMIEALLDGWRRRAGVQEDGV